MREVGGRLLMVGRFGVRIAAMVLNRPPAGKPAPTLIVCMVALLGQWNQEIELKTDLGLKCLIYHGAFESLRRVCRQ